MKRTYIKDIKEKIGEEVLIKGFAQTIRNQGGIKFIVLRDITGEVQIVVPKSEVSAFELVNSITTESVLSVRGKVKEEKQAPGGFEVQALEIEVLSLSAPELPIPILSAKGGEDTDISIRFDWRWLDLRKHEKQTIFKTWTVFEKGIREFFSSNNYIQIYTPSFMNTPSESGAEVFEVKYFDKKAFLAQSPQFYKQLAMASGFEKVFMVGPVFRAEPSYTTRHMTEFTGFDFEMSYVESHYDVMAEEEKIIAAGFKDLSESQLLDVNVPSIPFPKLTMSEAKKKLADVGVKSEKPYDLNAEEEVALYNIIKKETGHDFVFLTDWSIEARPFYHMRHEDNPKLTKSFDLLYRGLEISTGAQREHRVEVLERQAIEKGMSLESLSGYLNYFRFGCPPHGGVGLGPGRIIMKLLNLPSVKESTFLPRDVKRLTP